ncbi:peptidylprolyl isomerase [Paenibacillus doosanensis]|uniref:peptidylprolyl isomerase n=1 Tax=Paenibacillus doosanensis TaxID=1229154 RepID=UPI00217FBCF4|nr:peptidylprolyl isomerase [Paenibacillus doosanensis]MCS7458629.1 peptidylprolyl isomerase [Paenibacillus doosanensis]
MGQGFLMALLIVAGLIHYASVDGGAVEQGEGYGIESPAGAGNSSSQSNGSAGEDGTEAVEEAPAVSKIYAQPPEMTIDETKTYEATVHTNKGDFTIELFPHEAPVTVNNFVFLSREGYYNDVTFHRIVQSFMIQTGDPTGTGAGGPGYKFKDELNSPFRYEPGVVAMANSGPDTNGSQFFICTGPDSDYLNQMPNYTIFGRVTDGMDTVRAIAATPVGKQKQTGEESAPVEAVTIQSVDIVEKDAS